MGTTTRGYPYPESDDEPRTWEDIQALAAALNTDVQGLFDLYIGASKSVQSTTQTIPLVSSANTDTAVPGLSLSYDFKAGLAYEISTFVRFNMGGGSGPYAAFLKIKRASASGTVIHDPGNSAGIGAQFMSLGPHKCIVKCTAGNTTQTLVTTLAYTTAGSPTSINSLGSATGGRMYLEVKPIGLATLHSNALEIPTS